MNLKTERENQLERKVYQLVRLRESLMNKMSTLIYSNKMFIMNMKLIIFLTKHCQNVLLKSKISCYLRILIYLKSKIRGSQDNSQNK